MYIYICVEILFDITDLPKLANYSGFCTENTKFALDLNTYTIWSLQS